ncbi:MULTISPECIES: cytochrome c maturation protein CcmE [Stappiaceae]|jgi:cytochrome c-type biogenesis protein CcmE|uniref:Cytochrome c-type biogenesis protein CcmE n=2 Tax=Roseibium TaxID=150830 RepID=A0A0M6Y8J9_9HYPH|nr:MULTISPECIES: cytochrome c maturation protein CcmE [Stappiaceae]MCR9280255.1 cytochrome c maturation protein CcmE [Paracoccaceae bacterium]MEC9401083.1 cytochrome c maturation protein CcmE [Pseudomonadota bacterium]AMN54229.1 cytochrome C biogenesis protein CcmE [Labrenzia sp. CP4]AQQ02710.1 cytochrome c biogenesis protein CcmE [Roseibium aggregatum]MBN8180264.1 cytochrome c maturation protein CcmE [Roseibium aggregatum]
MTRKQRRLTLIGSAGAVLAIALTLILIALRSEIVFFQSPTEITQNGVAPGQRIRLGGLVEEGSVVRSDNAEVSFRVTDTANTVAVTYKGILPDLFREGQGVVTEGVVGSDGVFVADSVLAKHDENYIPKEVAEALKAQGHWQGEEGNAN